MATSSTSDPTVPSQTPMSPRFVYTTPTGRCIHRACCKHLKASTKALKICACVMESCGHTTRIYADDDDRLHVNTCPQAICRGKGYSDRRSAVTVGSIVEAVRNFGLPTVHTRRMDDWWIAFVSTEKKGEERLIRLKVSLSFVAISLMSCSIA